MMITENGVVCNGSVVDATAVFELLNALKEALCRETTRCLTDQDGDPFDPEDPAMVPQLEAT